MSALSQDDQVGVYTEEVLAKRRRDFQNPVKTSSKIRGFPSLR